MSEIRPVAPYKEVTFKGRTYIRPGISPARVAMREKRNEMIPGAPGTDENPIIKDGLPYVYSSTGKLVRRMDFDPETMEMFILKPHEYLSEEQILMIKKAQDMPVVYSEDCPKSTPEQLERFRQYGIARNRRRRMEFAAH